ncbi:MAG: bifunctional (p)ppGpp synthetase/guanosine-3',5'-bis(diphosphate) 3'-pyrophosphohydrolase [Deltaproteobacteria bacterium]|nr:bifunctional (p)ppGpp synthetase/guanosine-3',5'-bis(diphosphate) 3'-pyrophosphohydrolase [Deltaproteobacteria bacterium]
MFFLRDSRRLDSTNPSGNLNHMPQTAKAYGPRLYDAIELAARAHHGQVRKGTEIPYIVHPLAVAGILIRANCPEHLIIAGILHDTLEDTPVRLEEIRSQFGREVADLVVALSEPDKKAPWEERKAHTIDHLEQVATLDVLLVSVADKLDNMRAIRDGLESDGEDFWLRFNRPRESQKWYYQRLAGVFQRRISAGAGVALAQAFKVEVVRVFGAIPA